MNVLYYLAFYELIIFLKSESGIVKESDLEEIWHYFSTKTRYNALQTFINLKLIETTHNTNNPKYKRLRHITIKIDLLDTLHEV